MNQHATDPIDIAALLCSRVCHDVINPIGAIINGLEMLDDEKDAEMRGFALDLIRKSAEQASARLQFCRLAFGAAGSSRAMIDSSEAEAVARGLFDRQRMELRWNMPSLPVAKNKVKLILNLCLIAAATIPRGGVLEIAMSGKAEEDRIIVTAQGPTPKLASPVPELLDGAADQISSAPHGIQAYYTGLIARAAGMRLSVQANTESVTFAAEPVRANGGTGAAAG